MKPSVDELREYLSINKAALDEEIIQQPQLFFNVSEAFLHAADARDAAKEALAIMEAEIENEIRDTAESKKERITNDEVKALVRTDKSRKRAFKSYADLKREADILQALKEAFIQRSHMLKHLSELYIANYYEQNSVRGTSRTDTAVYMKQRQKISEMHRSKRKENSNG